VKFWLKILSRWGKFPENLSGIKKISTHPAYQPVGIGSRKEGNWKHGNVALFSVSFYPGPRDGVTVSRKID